MRFNPDPWLRSPGPVTVVVTVSEITMLGVGVEAGLAVGPGVGLGTDDIRIGVCVGDGMTRTAGRTLQAANSMIRLATKNDRINVLIRSSPYYTECSKMLRPTAQEPHDLGHLMTTSYNKSLHIN